MTESKVNDTKNTCRGFASAERMPSLLAHRQNGTRRSELVVCDDKRHKHFLFHPSTEASFNSVVGVRDLMLTSSPFHLGPDHTNRVF